MASGLWSILSSTRLFLISDTSIQKMKRSRPNPVAETLDDNVAGGGYLDTKLLVSVGLASGAVAAVAAFFAACLAW